jgi:hypothetical protein
LNNNDDNLGNLPLHYVLIIKYIVLSLPDFTGFDRPVGTYIHKIKREIIMTVKLLVTISSCYRTRNVCKTFQIAQCEQLGLNKKVLMSVITEVVAGFGVAAQGLGVVPLVFLGVGLVAVGFRVVGFGFRVVGFAVGAAVGLFEVGAAGFRVVAFGFGVVAAGFRVDAAGFEVGADSYIISFGENN